MSEGGFAEARCYPSKHWCCCWPCFNLPGTTPNPIAEVVNDLPWPHDGVQRQMTQAIMALHGPCFLQLFSLPFSCLYADFLVYFFFQPCLMNCWISLTPPSHDRWLHTLLLMCWKPPMDAAWSQHAAMGELYWSGLHFNEFVPFSTIYIISVIRWEKE